MSVIDDLINLDELKQRASRYEYQDFKVADFKLTGLSSDDDPIGLGYESYKLSDNSEALSSFKYHAGVPLKSLQSYEADPSLLQSIFNFHITEAGDKVIKGLVDTSTQKIVKVTTEGKRELLNPSDVIDRSSSTLSSFQGFYDDIIHPSGVSFKAVGSYQTAPQNKVGEFTHGGVSFNLGEVLEVASYTTTLVCTNGMQSSYVRSKKAVKQDSEEFYEKFQSAISEAYEESKTLANYLMQTDAIEICNPVDTMNKVMDELKFNKGQKNTVIKTYEVKKEAGEPDPATMYDIINLINYAAHYITKDTRKRDAFTRGAARLAGTYGDGQVHICPTCSNVV